MTRVLKSEFFCVGPVTAVVRLSPKLPSAPKTRFMKPADLYLSSRQFFAYAVPGVLWLAAVCYLAGRDPLMLIESGHEAIRVLLRVAVFLTGAYGIGFGAQKLFFWIATRRYTPTVSDLVRTQLTEAFPQLKDAPRIEKFCKLYVLENSRRLSSTIAEREVGINLRVGLPPAFVALGIGLILYSVAWGEPHVYRYYGAAGLLSGMVFFWALVGDN